MAAARRGPGLALLALPALAAASEPAAPGGSERAVGALLGVLLCLALGLALAWRHLCRLSAGRYHPRPLGRRALALLRGRLRGRGRPGGDDGDDGDSDDGGDGDDGPRHRHEELPPWSPGQREEPEEDTKEEEEEMAAALGPEAEGAWGESPPGVGQAAGGSAEALLGDPRAFSASAAWGDARPHGTAL